MGLFSQEIERTELNAGDHIYSWRKSLYSHHGIFIGEDRIIHFVSPKREGTEGNSYLERFKISSTSGISDKKKCKTPCPKSYCGLEKVAGSGVKLSCIDCFVKNGSLNRYKYQANHAFLLAKTVGGTCTTAASDPPEEVIHRATYLYENRYPTYDLLNNNCEDFALYCTTGLWSTDKGYQGRSGQGNMVNIPLSSNYKKYKDINVVLQQVATVIPKYYLKRSNKDLGSRKDVVKVPVEELWHFIRMLSQ